jgi:hypothetical protein
VILSSDVVNGAESQLYEVSFRVVAWAGCGLGVKIAPRVDLLGVDAILHYV